MIPFYQNNIEIMKRKNADYSGYDSHPYANFKAVNDLGVKTVDGFLTRMMDKICRIRTLSTREAQVKDESVKDTLSDLANYAMLLHGYLAAVNTREKQLSHAIAFFEKCERFESNVLEPYESILKRWHVPDALYQIAHKARLEYERL